MYLAIIPILTSRPLFEDSGDIHVVVRRDKLYTLFNSIRSAHSLLCVLAAPDRSVPSNRFDLSYHHSIESCYAIPNSYIRMRESPIVYLAISDAIPLSRLSLLRTQE